jgi:hypothetical protein
MRTRIVLCGAAVALVAAVATYTWCFLFTRHATPQVVTSTYWLTHAPETIHVPDVPLSHELEPAKPQQDQPAELQEVIDLTELQRIAPRPAETVEPPLAGVVPAVVIEDSQTIQETLKVASAESTTTNSIPVDFLPHSADGPLSGAAAADSHSGLWKNLMSLFCGTATAEGALPMTPFAWPNGTDHSYHQQHPECPYHGCPGRMSYSYDPVRPVTRPIAEEEPEDHALQPVDKRPVAEEEPESTQPAPLPRLSKRKPKLDTLDVRPGDLPANWLVWPY